jgi:multicomponent Na+:H+ antiporter subunit A
MRPSAARPKELLISVVPSPKTLGGAPGRIASAIAFVLSLIGFLAAATLVPAIAEGGVVRADLPWVPSLGVRFSFIVDGLSLLFILLICGTGTVVSLYASAYLHGEVRRGRFFVYLVMFEMAMLGLVAANDLITLFVFWELTTVASYLLIGFDHGNEKARRNAWQALLVTGSGGLALLAGFLLLAEAGGSFTISELIRRGDGIRAHPLYSAIFVLVLAGAFTKSAQLPFHFWLPNAMAAPTPVSAYLHSATMVKAGIYLLARLHPALSGTDGWLWTLTIVGAATAIWASVVALRQTDLKLALAYTTVMALGTLTMFLAANAPVAIAAAVTFLLVHALYKCALFLIVGIIDHATGTREIERLAGLARAMPITAIAAGLAALSMAGFPPFLGFIGKELKYEGALAVASEPVFIVVAAVTANALMVAMAGIVAVAPFRGPAATAPGVPHDPSVRLWIGPLVLAALGLFFGLLPPLAADLLVQPAVGAILGTPATVKLALWHGVNVPLILSIVTVTAGIIVYQFRSAVRAQIASMLDRLPVTADGVYDRIFAATVALAKSLTMALQNGSLRRYLAVVLATTTLAVGGTLIARDGIVLPSVWPDAAFFEWMIVILIAAGAALPIAFRDRLAAICGLSIVGAGIALIFLLYGAPDVAMTQLLVEILFVVMIATILMRLPDVAVREGSRHRTAVDGAIAASAGIVVTLLMFAVLQTPINRHLTDFFEANSVPLAYGRNIVNVILVDFRALDTLGEIIVVAVAAIGALAVLRLRAQRETRD